jgi:aspartyl-tRNA(Asn)/glutamyl-tRNA(Gln) amidotransferase subunit B
MRSKETSTDYRYFPEPDLLPVELSDAFINQIQADMPELPDAKSSRFQSEYQLTEADARLFANDLALANYFETVAQGVTEPKTAANWIKGDLIGKLNETETQISVAPVSPSQLVELIGLIEQDVISGKIAKEIFQGLWSKEADSPRAYVETKGLKQVSDAGALEPLIQTLIDANPKQANDLREGKDKLMGFFVGQVMKETSGQANPQQVNRILRHLLGL